MNTKNIIAVIFLLMATVSCSMDDTTVLDNMSQDNATSEYSYIFCNVATGVSTKSITAGTEAPAEEEAKIKNAIFFLLDNAGNVVNSITTETATASMKTKIKKNNNMSVYVVANVTTETLNVLKGKTSKAEILSTELTNADFVMLPKRGEKGFTCEASNNVNVTVEQLTARIDVNVNVKYSENAPKVVLKKIEMSKYNTVGFISGDVNTTAEELLGSAAFNEEFAHDGIKSAQFRSFARNQATTIMLDMTIGGKDVTKVYTIKDSEKNNANLNINYLYRMNINLTISDKTIDATVNMSVEGWEKETIEFEINM